MGGHGGLNILPQKKWNVYNWDNRIKVNQNEKLVKAEISRRKKIAKLKRFDNNIRSIKSGVKDLSPEKGANQEFEMMSVKEKNKMFKEIMESNSNIKKIETDIYFEKMSKPIKSNEHINLFEYEELNSKKRKVENSSEQQEDLPEVFISTKNLLERKNIL